MNLLFGHSWWGLQHLGWKNMVEQLVNAGFDYAEVYVPDNEKEREQLFLSLHKRSFPFVIHQYQATGKNFEEFKNNFKAQLDLAASYRPILISSHTGKDCFSFEQNAELLKIAGEAEQETGILIVHETHRGSCLYSPGLFKEYYKDDAGLKITADFSHWCCVSESLLEEHEDVLAKAIECSFHIHARIGHSQGSQISNPKHKRWSKERNRFFYWWLQIVNERNARNEKSLTITPEFGPFPYQWSAYSSGKPAGDILEMNVYLMRTLRPFLSSIIDQL